MNSIMFSIQSAKELTQRLDLRIFKEKNMQKLKSEDPERLVQGKQNVDESIGFSDTLSRQPTRKEKNTLSPIQRDAPPGPKEQNKPQLAEGKKQNTKSETEPGQISSQQKNQGKSKFKPLFQKIRSVFNKYVISSVSLSAGKIKDLIRDKYQQIEENSVMQLEESLDYLDRSLKEQPAEKLIRDEQNSNVHLQKEENNRYLCSESLQ